MRVLGFGSFADVFLYEQNLPRRQVAVKVLLNEGVNDQVRQMFRAEANLMAQLSVHPSILTVYQVSVAADGRPYLVMENCAASLVERSRGENFPLSEVLSTGIRVASALETAHRAGVLHRDVKPGNILTTVYGHPVLADFGIAASLVKAEVRDLTELSMPWAAPEVLSGASRGTVASEIWPPAATLCSLFAGHASFERPENNNANEVLQSRIDKVKITPLTRSDVPPQLVGLLFSAMAKRPEDRPRSMLSFARRLQAIEVSLGLPQAQIEAAMDDWALATLGSDSDGASIRPSLGFGSRRKPVPLYATPGSSFTVTGPTKQHEAALAKQRGHRGRLLLLGCVVALVVAGSVATLEFTSSRQRGIPVVATINVQLSSGTAVFRWSSPGLSDGDSYQVRRSDGGQSVQRAGQYQVAGKPGEQLCIIVLVNRQGMVGKPSREVCVEF